MVLVNYFPPDAEVPDPDGTPFPFDQVRRNPSAGRPGPVGWQIMDEGNVVIYGLGCSSRLQSITHHAPGGQSREGGPFQSTASTPDSIDHLPPLGVSMVGLNRTTPPTLF